MKKPTLCGRNKVNLPESGCGDCAELEYRIGKLEEWVESGFMSAEDIIALTPIECYEPPCRDSRVCYGEACCMVVACNQSTSCEVCEGGVDYATVYDEESNEENQDE